MSSSSSSASSNQPLRIRRALISVSDKTGIDAFARRLAALGVEIISTGGTAAVLRKAGVDVVGLSSYTGFPEMLDGRLKSLHPKIYAGLLFRRDCPGHVRQLKKYSIEPIDMVVVNLYPFERVARRAGVGLGEAIENIDIGGPSMLRAAAKNYQSVAVVTAPALYETIARQMEEQGGRISQARLKQLGLAAFRMTALYDQAIASFLDRRFSLTPQESVVSEGIGLRLERMRSLRYGENPHQKASLYKDSRTAAASLVGARQLHGKELSFNNYLDLNAALEIVRAFDGPTACVVKHGNPTGVARGRSLIEAFKGAWQTDRLSAFGGIVGLNRALDDRLAKVILASGFLECILAPGYGQAALRLLRQKKNLRLIKVSFDKRRSGLEMDFKKIRGGFLVQETDVLDAHPCDLKVVTRKRPTAKQMQSLLFAWKVVKYVKSNAIVVVRQTRTVGIGMGQTSRVDSVFMALKRAGTRAEGGVLASDAFFPKADNITLAKKAGIRAIIQPGASIADADIIRAADKAKIAMVMTGMRHFKH